MQRLSDGIATDSGSSTVRRRPIQYFRANCKKPIERDVNIVHDIQQARAYTQKRQQEYQIFKKYKRGALPPPPPPDFKNERILTI